MKNYFFRISITILLLIILPSCGEEPIANFTWEPLEPKAGGEVKFTNLSTNAKSYSWNFGDMSIGDEKNPSHAYESKGEYIVDLFAYNGLRSDVQTSTINVKE